MDIKTLKKLHSLASYHKKQLENCDKCGCFNCCKIFKKNKIKEWIDGRKTALCPHCGIDSVLPIPQTINYVTLREMRDYWFKTIK